MKGLPHWDQCGYQPEGLAERALIVEGRPGEEQTQKWGGGMLMVFKEAT